MANEESQMVQAFILLLDRPDITIYSEHSMKDGFPVPTSPAVGNKLYLNIMLDIGQTDRECKGIVFCFTNIILLIFTSKSFC